MVDPPRVVSDPVPIVELPLVELPLLIVPLVLPRSVWLIVSRLLPELPLVEGVCCANTPYEAIRRLTLKSNFFIRLRILSCFVKVITGLPGLLFQNGVPLTPFFVNLTDFHAFEANSPQLVPNAGKFFSFLFPIFLVFIYI